jgi:hypothetical protein
MGFMGLSSQQGFSRRRAEDVGMRWSEHLSLAAYSAAGKKNSAGLAVGIRTLAASSLWASLLPMGASGVPWGIAATALFTKE